jgi:hypothetical protein
MARETSIETYLKIKRSGLLSSRRLEIYECLFNKGPLTASQVFVLLGLETNQSGRFTELSEMEVIKEVGTITCPITNNTAILWDVTAKLPVKIKRPVTASKKKKKTDALELMQEIANSKELSEPVLNKLRRVYSIVLSM